VRAAFSIFLVLTLTLIVGVAGAQIRLEGWHYASEGRLKEPHLSEPVLKTATFGDAKSIRLLAELLNDDDPAVRSQAVWNLGETHNPGALPHIRTASKDPDAMVRGSAVGAAEAIGTAPAAKIVADALGDSDRTVLLRAIRSAGRMRLAAAKKQLPALLAGDDAVVQATVLASLTDMEIPADALTMLLASDSPVVRLRAIENAVLREHLGVLKRPLTALAKKGHPSQRAAAIVTLGKLAFEDASGLIRAAEKDKKPLLRRAAVLAYAHGGKGEKLLAYLSDESPAVRLAAIRSAGKLKQADCVARLFEIMLATPLDDETARFILPFRTDIAIRDSLAKIGTKEVERRSAGVLKAFVAKGDNSKAVTIDSRNVRMCAWILGELKSAEGYASLISLLKSLKLDADALGEVVRAIGKIGRSDEETTNNLIARLERSRSQGVRYLQSLQRPGGANVEFSETTTVELITALGRLKCTRAAALIRQVALINVNHTHLDNASATAGRVLPSLATAENRSAIASTINKVVSTKSYGLIAIFEMSKAAGKLKARDVLAALKNILTVRRPEKHVIVAAAWAIQEIEGATPTLTDPHPNKGKHWIIRTTRR